MDEPQEQPQDGGGGKIVPFHDGRSTQIINSQTVGAELYSKQSNIDTSTEYGRALKVNVQSTVDFNVPDASGMTFQATWYLLTAAERVDEDTGEVSQFPWLVFIGPDGETLGTSGKAVCHALSRIIAEFGNGPWSPPLQLRFSERKARRSGRTYHDVRVVARAEEKHG